MEENEPTNQSKNPFRLAREPRKANAPLVVDENTTAWEIYNDRASTYDREMIKDWNESLNTLLIFAALYSAVLTAFIIESMKLLQEDVTETTRDILLVITRQLANTSAEPFKPEPFVAPDYAVRVNYYFFTSISCSLVAALGAVLALQWVGSYDAGLNQSSSEQRALQRHFRYEGIEKWKMGEILALLPTLIFAALFLFFIGLAEWMWVIHHGIAGIIIAGLICGASFFGITTLISMIYVRSPFRTAASRSLPQLFTRFSHILIMILIYLSYLAAHVINTWKNRHANWSSFGAYMTSITPFDPLVSFSTREANHVNSSVDTRGSALLWLANRIDVSPHMAHHFRTIIQDILSLPLEQLVKAEMANAPWGDILELLIRTYVASGGEIIQQEPDLNEVEFILKMCCLMDFEASVRGGRLEDLYKFPSIREGRSTGPLFNLAGDNRQPPIYTFVLALECFPSVSPDFIVAMITILRASTEMGKSADPYSPDRFVGFCDQVIDVLRFDLGGNGPPMPDELLEAILGYLSDYYLRGKKPPRTSFDRYLRGVETALSDKDTKIVDSVARVHDAIISQFLGGYRQKLNSTLNYEVPLSQLYGLLRVQRSHAYEVDTITVLLQILRAKRPGEEDEKWMIAHIYGWMLYLQVSGNARINWAEWSVNFYLGLESLLYRNFYSSTNSRQLIWSQAENVHWWLNPRLSAGQISRLLRLKDPILRVYAASLADEGWEYPTAIPTIVSENREAWAIATECWYLSQRRRSKWSISTFEFFCTLIAECDFSFLETVLFNLDKLEKVAINGNPLESVHWNSVFRKSNLERLMQASCSLSPIDRIRIGHGGLIEILLNLCQFEWFLCEFDAANGFMWTAEMVSQDPDNFEKVACILLAFLETKKSDIQVQKSIYCLHEILSSLPARAIKPASYRYEKGIRLYRLEDPKPWMKILTAIHSNQELERQSAVPSDSGPSTGGNDANSTSVENNGHNVKTWSEEKWKQWKEMMEDVIFGLPLGFIAYGPLVTSRLARDPDGFCMWKEK